VATLRVRGLRERIAGRSEHRYEQLDLDHLPREGINDVRLLPRVIDERLVAGEVRLPHRDALLADPLAVPLTEGRVPIALWVLLEILQMQELKRHARAAQLDMEVGQVGLGSPITLAATRPIHALLELLIVELVDRFPVEAQRLGTNGRTRYAPGADAHSLGGLSMAAPELQLVSQDLS